MNGATQDEVRRPTEDGVRARLMEAGLCGLDACVAGTTANLIVLQAHALTLRTFALDDHSRSALEFRV